MYILQVMQLTEAQRVGDAPHPAAGWRQSHHGRPGLSVPRDLAFALGARRPRGGLQFLRLKMIQCCLCLMPPNPVQGQQSASWGETNSGRTRGLASAPAPPTPPSQGTQRCDRSHLCSERLPATQDGHRVALPSASLPASGPMNAPWNFLSPCCPFTQAVPPAPAHPSHSFAPTYPLGLSPTHPYSGRLSGRPGQPGAMLRGPPLQTPVGGAIGWLSAGPFE